MNASWLKMSAADLGRGIDAGRIDPVDLTKTYLEAIRAHPFKNRIYARLTGDRALAEAKAAAARAKSGMRFGPLDGVPISWKDLYDTAGVITEAGSELLQGRTPGADAEVLKNATLAGLVCLGKTHMTELAFSGLGLNPVTESPPCVNDHEAVSGGSSSGAATSVAFGLAACGIGSDTGGSVRIPSAWNDLVGLKTTSGRLSLRGVVPLAAKFDTVGPLARSVEDAALVLAALEGGKPADLNAASLSGMRLLVLENGLANARAEPLVAFEDATRKLAKAGAVIESAHIPIIDEAMALAGVLYTTEAYATWATEIEANPEKMYEAVRVRFETGKQYSGVEYVRAWQRLDAIRAEYAAMTAGFDAVILPSSSIMPPNLARLEADAEYFTSENLLALNNTRMGNLTGGASLTIPTHTPSAGIMFMSPPLSEERLLRIGAAAEAALA
ncbi:MAG: amidase [Rhodobacteraceae bacterium]|nr:amidase [Paracoccaceae bacterium]